MIYELDPIKGKGKRAVQETLAARAIPPCRRTASSIAFLTGEWQSYDPAGDPARRANQRHRRAGRQYLQSLDWAPDGSGFFTTLNTEQ